MKLKIGRCRLKCTAGDYGGNAGRAVASLEETSPENLDILSFLGCYLTGCFRSAERARQHSLRVDGPEIKNLLSQTARFETTVIVGFSELRGERLYNTVWWRREGSSWTPTVKPSDRPG